MTLNERLKHFLQARTRRERITLLLGALASVLILVYLIHSVLSEDLANLKIQYQTNRQTLIFLQHVNTKIKALQAAGYRPQGPKSSDLIGTVNQLLNQNALSGFNPTLQQTDSNHLTLSFTEVPFDQLMGFLQVLWTQHDIGVETADIKPLATEGLVAVTLGLS